MSIGLRSRPHRVVRPAPPGSRRQPQRADRPPDGWEPIAPSLPLRAGEQLDSLVLRAADSAARAVSRRDFLKQVARVGVVAGLAWNSLVTDSRRARAHGMGCDYFGDPDANPCGPSPRCADRYCRDDGQCKLNEAGVRRQRWATGECGPDDVDNTWIENCCGQINSHVRCADCCVPENPNSCVGGCTLKMSCFCRENQGGCPH
jgi:hypothetical protein